jgi:hypothetical protein
MPPDEFYETSRGSCLKKLLEFEVADVLRLASEVAADDVEFGADVYIY